MKNLVRFTLAQSVLFNLLFVILMVVGAWAFLTMPVERFPNVAIGKIYVETAYPGASPAEVEALVTREIEDALDDLENVEFIKSSSYRQHSTVVVKFIDDTDYTAGLDQIRFKVLRVLDELPPEADPPRFNAIDVNDWLPAVSVNLLGDRSNRALTLMAKEIKIALRQIPGVKEVKLRGELEKEFHVLLDPDQLTRHGVTFDQAAQALGQSGVSIPAGDFTTPGGEFVIRADERYRTRQQVMDAIVRTDADGSFVRISDLASSALLSYRDPTVLTSVNGSDCVTLSVIKTNQGNALDIVTEVHKILERFKPAMEREKVSLVLTQDSTIKINDAMNTMGWNLLVGVFLVCAVIAYFMGFRNAIITTVGIPFSFLLTMVFMKFTGNSLNEVTLFCFVLVSGIIVDDAIVVVENIYRHYESGEPLYDAVVNGASEVAWPVVSATSTTAAAFLPMLIMTGSTGEFFALIPKAVTFALAASVFECLFILPLHYRDWGPKKLKSHIDEQSMDFSGEGVAMRGARRFTSYLLTRALKHRWLTLVLVGLLFISAVGIAAVSASGAVQLIKVKFFPDDYSLYYINVEAPITWPIERTNQRVKEIADFIMKDGKGQARSAAAITGFYISEDYEPIFGANLAHIAVTLPAKDDRRFADHPTNDPVAHVEWVRGHVAPLATGGLKLWVRPEKDGPPAGKDINVRAVGPNHESVGRLSADIRAYLAGPAMRGSVIDIADDRGQPSRVFRFQVIPERAAEFGVTPAQVITLAGTVLNGRYVGKYRLVDEDVDLKVKLDPAAMTTPERALDLPLLEHPSGPVRLGDLARPKLYSDLGQLNRYQGERAVTITGNLKPAAPLSTAAVVQRVGAHYRKIAANYPGATLSFAGEFESTRKSFQSLLYAFGVALLIIYVILATQFKSYAHPLIILSAVSFALIGVIYGKFLTRTLFTVNSFVATVGVAGVVVNDALVLVEFLNKRLRSGLDRRQALWQAVNIRLRPILLTTLTTTLGLLPMAVGFPEYSLVWGTMASTFVTGLCTATFLTIIVVPVMWDLVEAHLEKRAAKKAAKLEV
ncbi:MAG: efflux RND transporter permease subunit [Desulfarculaceae bacterium]|nr:efflux RND transporter permease subunit [Desulfarculaceae bacterium]MCF8072639.1 efflux RND transporter permease subunit [Desulfarculaceae bacterium]MCF8102518.1 efflux RND transporter permease subunit [Desulfarculaceae bacterium]MCF8117979.1 efflux RND transporter permease subunit [Desulfarculaceae bacterium]